MDIPTTKELKEESLLSDIEFVKEEIAELARLKAEVKKKTELLAEHMKVLGEVMQDLDLEELKIAPDVKIIYSKPHSYKRLLSFKEFVKKYGDFVEQHPDVVKEVNVRGHLKLKTIP